MPKTLPENATPASRRLYDLAVRLAESCPPELASDIALVGSAAMGLSDDQSDLDINFWSETIPPEADRVAWLESMGATNFNVQKPRPDRSYGIGCVISGVDVGCSWQTFTSLQFFVDIIAEGSRYELYHMQLPLGELTNVLVQAIPLRTTGVIEAAQSRLYVYPDKARDEGIKNWLQNFVFFENGYKRFYGAIRYGDDPYMTHIILGDVGSLLHSLYYINRQWQPSTKWQYKLAGTLPLKPPNLYERIGLALHDPDVRQRPIYLARLMLDTLALVQDEYDVSAAVNTIQAFIDENS